MQSRILSIRFDKKERPIKAVIHTPLGLVKVEWRDVCGDLCWFTSGVLDAKKLASSAIGRIESMAPSLY